MGRAPCCEKMGLKKGPWTPQEDQILTSYIQLHGHSNWRALPKLAGLLRCGKSCRLRWVNYLKPDIKRGDFTPEEEEGIIKFHELLGNRWSAIAARLPGRTDNEIKNVWHTHLKKRLSGHQPKSNQEKQKKHKKNQVVKPESALVEQNKESILLNDSTKENTYSPTGSPQRSAATTTTTTTTTTTSTDISSEQFVPEIDESFWSENLTIDDFEMVSTLDINVDNSTEFGIDQSYVGGGDGETDFWYDVFVRAGGLPELPEL